MPRFILFVILTAIFLAGCVGPAPAPRINKNIVTTNFGASQAPVTDAWWQSFDDEVLNALVSRALTENFSLRSARARVERVSATVRQQPEGGLIEALHEVGILKDRYQAKAGFWGYSASVAMSYELNLWETISPELLPAEIQVWASRADLSAAAINLSANVAKSYFALIKSRAELQLLQRQTRINNEILQLLGTNRHGTPQPDETMRQQQLIAATDTQRIEAEARHQLLTHQLAVLVGAPVSEFELPPTLPQLKKLPPLPYSGIPAEWLMRRPDLQAAFLRIQVVDPTVARIVASYFPKINLSTLVSPVHMLEDWLMAVASKISLPLLERVNINVDFDLTEKRQAEALAEYRQKVLTAVREVEDVLVAEKRDRELFKSLTERVKLARDAFTHLKYRYANGVVDYFEVYTALRDLQNLEQKHLMAKLALPLNRVAVAHALAGSWNQPQPIRQPTLQSASLFEMLKHQRAYGERAG